MNYEEMFYGTLPPDTQDFSQVLSGVGRSLRDISRGISYYPYDLLGSGVDVANLALGAAGLGSERPVFGSDYLRNIARSLGLAEKPTGSAAENITRLAAGLTNPMVGARAVGKISDITTEQANRAADALVKAITRNPQATAPQVLQETAMPFMQAVAPRPSGLLETPVKSDLGFYSALEQATIPLQNKGTGSQFLAQIEKTAGVKPEEVKWTGLDEFLKSKPTVTKQEVQDYLAANRVDLQEVRLGEQATQWRGNTLYQNDQPLGKILDTYQGYRYAVYGGQEVPLQSNNLAGAVKEAEQISGLSTRAQTAETKPKFSSYTLPGGENYREILLTLPDANTARQAKIDAINKQYNAVLGGRAIADLPPAEKAVIDRLTAEHNAIADAPIGQDFRSSHFDQPNILAHMRVNDRVVDGKKTLFIEEVQSDWHQAGRKRGYRQSEEFKPMVYKPEDFQVSQTESQWVTTDARGQQRVVGKGTVGSEQEAKEYFARWLTGLEKEQAGRSTVERSSQVPDAPFKTTWHELALKRAIQEASEKGYDRIAFTTGKTQAERYDLSKQVDEINVVARTSATSGEQIRTIGLDTTDGKSIKLAVQSNGIVGDVSSPEARNFIGQDLSEIVGKELAEKIMNGGSQTISGEGLRVGGKGMEGFYDNILPKTLDKLGKKFDAKVGKTTMDDVEVWSMDITPKMRESVLTKGQPLFQAAPLIPAGLLDYEE